ncbi:hypothetical protein GCM10027423_33010 [Spirosoma arcticum]
MMSSALFMGLLGIATSFLPDELLNHNSIRGANPLFVQVTGALYLSSASINWTAKSVLIGGIYARPIALGNFIHFSIGAIVLGKSLVADGETIISWVVSVPYVLFALLFGLVLFGNPINK